MKTKPAYQHVHLITTVNGDDDVSFFGPQNLVVIESIINSSVHQSILESNMSLSV